MTNELEQFIIASKSQLLLKKEFNLAMANCPPDGFVKKPESLRKSSMIKKKLLPQLRDVSKESQSEILRRKGAFQDLGLTGNLDSAEYAVRSILIQQRLIESGAIFGDKALNFVVDKVFLPQNEIKQIEDLAVVGFKNLKTCRPSESTSYNSSEAFINSFKCTPNAARVDIIVTESGPKIIEVNCQWVDGIQFLEGLRETFLGSSKTVPSEIFATQFRNPSELAVIYLNSATGSRATGETRSLRIMAENLLRRNYFTKVEVVNPGVVRPAYLSSFNSIYLNGDPRMIDSQEAADWITTVFGNTNLKVFPAWRPELDKKEVLVEASERWPELFAKTYRFSDRDMLGVTSNSSDWVLKGDGFSSRQVALSGTLLFGNVWADAELFPGDYVLQEMIKSTTLKPVFCFDTSKDVPVLIEKPFSKYNVWIIGDRVAGTMISLSDEQMISDKDFNTVPTPC